MTLTVLEPGLCTLVVDCGRPHTRGLGVPVGGAADRSALAIGNALVGNPASAAALEITLAGPTLQAQGELACVVYGAPFALESDRQTLQAGQTFTLQPGEVLRIGATAHGMRAYFCVRGGFHEPAILESQSSLEPLVAGASLRCTAGWVHHRFIRHEFRWDQHPTVLAVLDGQQRDWFPAEDITTQEFTVSSASSRMGLRLRGRPPRLPERELLSEPVCPGSVQVTRDGQCIILGVDGQTIGGYPKIAQVVTADLDKLAQLRPEDRIRFRRVSLEEAELLYRRKQSELHEWLTRLRTTLAE
jgi:5-oxoprolinase (ATP-hydrolysing) subunit C